MKHIVDQLGDCEGTLITDGYGAYEKFDQQTQTLTHAQCRVHCRRTFEEAKESEPESVAIALAYIGRFYEHETAAGTHPVYGYPFEPCRQEPVFHNEYNQLFYETF